MQHLTDKEFTIYFNTVKAIITKMYGNNRFIELEDAYQMAAEGLLKADLVFNPDKSKSEKRKKNYYFNYAIQMVRDYNRKQISKAYRKAEFHDLYVQYKIDMYEPLDYDYLDLDIKQDELLKLFESAIR